MAGMVGPRREIGPEQGGGGDLDASQIVMRKGITPWGGGVKGGITNVSELGKMTATCIGLHCFSFLLHWFCVAFHLFCTGL